MVFPKCWLVKSQFFPMFYLMVWSQLLAADVAGHFLCGSDRCSPPKRGPGGTSWGLWGLCRGENRWNIVGKPWNYPKHGGFHGQIMTTPLNMEGFELDNWTHWGMFFSAFDYQRVREWRTHPLLTPLFTCVNYKNSPEKWWDHIVSRWSRDQNRQTHGGVWTNSCRSSSAYFPEATRKDG